MITDNFRIFQFPVRIADILRITFPEYHFIHSKHHIDRCPYFMTHICKENTFRLICLHSFFSRFCQIDLLPVIQTEMQVSNCTDSKTRYCNAYDGINNDLFLRQKPDNRLRLCIGNSYCCNIDYQFNQYTADHLQTLQHKYSK